MKMLVLKMPTTAAVHSFPLSDAALEDRRRWEAFRSPSVQIPMSLTDLLSSPFTRSEARACIDVLLPSYRRVVPSRASISTSCGHPQLVGTAFDYASRLELAWLHPEAATGTWIAEQVLTMLPRQSRSRQRASAVVRAAREASEAWPLDDVSRHGQMAIHSVQLAQLDVVYRSGYPPSFGAESGIDEQAAAAEVFALMTQASSLWALATREPLVLNPSFGLASHSVGGADADLIAGNTLVEIKTTKAACIERDHMRQLLGYAILARAERRLPKIQSVAVYFSRHGVLEEIPLRTDVVESTYFEAADRLAELWQQRKVA